MNEVTIHHLNRDAPTRNILPVISKGSFTPEIYYAIAIPIRMGCVPIFAIVIAIPIHPIEKNCNRNRNRVLILRGECTLRQWMAAGVIREVFTLSEHESEISFDHCNNSIWIPHWVS